MPHRLCIYFHCLEILLDFGSYDHRYRDMTWPTIVCEKLFKDPPIFMPLWLSCCIDALLCVVVKFSSDSNWPS